MSEDIKEILKKWADKTTKEDLHEEYEDFIPYEVYGGNSTDAYNGGRKRGKAELSRKLLKLLEE